MSLITCKECRNQVSDAAKSCPSCGAKVPQKTSKFTLFIAGIIGFSVLMAVFKEDQPTAAAAANPPKTPEQVAAQNRREANFQFAVQATRRLQTTLNNPKSFELVSAGVIDQGPLCLIYRTTNQFNALMVEHAVIGRDFKMGNWNKDCANKSGLEDVTSLRHAL